MQKRTIALLVIGLLVLATPIFLSAASVPKEGTPAPTFSLQSQDGSTVSLDGLKGKWVVLYFYPKDMTSGCTIEARGFQRDQKKYEERNAIVLGVSTDDIKSHKEFCAKEGLTFKLLADTEHKVAQEYGSLRNLGVMKIANRNTFIIDPSGKIVKVYEGVNPNKHSEEVLAALDTLKK